MTGRTAIDFGFDGEIVEFPSLSAEVHPRALEMFVGGSYDSDPDQGGG